VPFIVRCVVPISRYITLWRVLASTERDNSIAGLHQRAIRSKNNGASPKLQLGQANLLFNELYSLRTPSEGFIGYIWER
jgi:hypothetical protein